MWTLILILLISFLQIGLFSIGGGYATIPLIQEQVVNIHKWLTFQEFTDIITISQMTPGPLAVNTSTFVGIRVAGIPGAVTATFGCVISGFIISILLYNFFNKYRKADTVLNILKGLRAVSVGLIASSASTILLIAFGGISKLEEAGRVNINTMAIIIFVVSIFLLRKFKLNPMLIMVLSGTAGFFLY
ncbi:chromate transporter [Fusobacterium varium]|uniref:chromate transporter n=1 Tax=Fusobacterium TaxID=848 RepID=UPI0010318145|nr:chromate transporter [Fusobacterium ulcerans]